VALGSIDRAEAPLPEGQDPTSRFAATDWSLVLAAGGTDAAEARPAMCRLLERYWYPLYAFVRRGGRDPNDASDLTQEFLTRLVERNSLSLADPTKGKFRTFLLTSLERFLVDDHRRENREKRGGGRTILSLTLLEAEDRYQLEPADTLTPERIYERRWAMTLLERALERLGQESDAAGRGALFAALKPLLAGEPSTSSYQEIAGELAMNEGALKTAAHRLRRRYAALVRAEIAETLSDPNDVEDEVRHLFRSLE
jgi:RNA polymerase sigma factor (sigma-70 family)